MKTIYERVRRLRVDKENEIYAEILRWPSEYSGYRYGYTLSVAEADPFIEVPVTFFDGYLTAKDALRAARADWAAFAVGEEFTDGCIKVEV